jgi:hypothetical protein
MIQARTEDQIYEGLKAFGPAPGSKQMMKWEYKHACEAMESGIYVTFLNESKSEKNECFRVGSESLCFCGHFFDAHEKKITKKNTKTACNSCSCKSFKFIFRRPEEQGLWHLPRRKGKLVLFYKNLGRLQYKNLENEMCLRAPSHIS